MTKEEIDQAVRADDGEWNDAANSAGLRIGGDVGLVLSRLEALLACDGLREADMCTVQPRAHPA